MKTSYLYIDLIAKACRGRNTGLNNLSVWALKMLPGILLFLLLSLQVTHVYGQTASASFNYTTQTGTLGTTYSWIDCSAGTSIVSGDDSRASVSWPFNFSFYDNDYTTANNLSVATNGFIRLNGNANTGYSAASAYTLSSSSTELGQIIAMAVYDGQVRDNGGWVKYLVTGTTPNRVFTIEYNNLEIDYNDARYVDVQVSFYETSNKVVLKLGNDNLSKSGVDMGIHSGVSGYYNKWQEVASGTNNTWIEYTPGEPATPPTPPAASWNYNTQTGTLGTGYSWIDCTSGASIVSGDDAQAEFNWPFDFNFYDNSYTTGNKLSVCTNGFIRLDGIASVDYNAASNYNLTSTATNLGQQIALALYDGKVGDNGGWVKELVTGTAPNRILTVEFNTYEIDYNDKKYANVQVSFYETTNKIVLKFGTDNINKNGVDMGLHSGVDTYFDKWQEVRSGTNNSWIEYTPPYIEVNATAGNLLAYYFDLKGAFDKINDGTHQGDITIKLKSSTVESSSAVLNASGKGGASYSSVNLYPTKSGLSVSGNIAAPLIDLNGADNVTIDGRVNASGTTNDLNLINTSSTSANDVSTIRFINDASNNTVKYCTLKASGTLAGSGVVFFSTTTSSNGNDNNTIDNNNITNAADANRPVNAIYSAGTTGKANSGNIFSNNTIFDFLKHASASNGIYLASNTTNCTIDSNSFYETTSFTPTGSVTYNAIKINNVSGGGFTVLNNSIGGTAALCGGSAWTKVNSRNNVFNAIYIKAGTEVASSIQNNTIKNFSWSNSGIANWSGIFVDAGTVNIGTVTGNTIGEPTGTNSISVNGGTNGQRIYGIKLNSASEINCSNNSIGSITGSTASTLSTQIYGIYLSGTATADITSNTIGSTTTASSIYASSESTSNAQKVYGIYSTSTGITTIHENTISNLKNNTSNTAVGTRGLINGIYISSGANTVSQNTIKDISIANANNSAGVPAAAGVLLKSSNGVQSVSDNLIYNISNTYASFTGCVIGIYTKNNTGASAGDVNSNFIHSLSVAGSSSGAKIYGIYENTDNISYTNNIITLGGNTSTEIFGVYDVGNSGKTVDFFFNTIYISGTNSGSEKSYALRYNTSNNTRDLRNNILFNARSGGTGSHYAIYYDATAGTFTADYNDYVASGTGGVLGYFGGDKTTLASLQTANSQDANSLNINPNFTSAGGINSSDYIASAVLPGIAGTGVTIDFDGITRDNPPKMGALESSLSYVWQGNTSTDFATSSNWENGMVPPDGADISFAATPVNDCYLDQNRTLKNITNTSAKKLVVNGKQLTLKGSFIAATTNQIDATATSSIIIFDGDAAQSIPDGVFVSNTIDAVTNKNVHGLTQNGALTIQTNLALTNGAYKIGANTLTINGTISTVSGTLTGGNTSNIVFGGTGANTILPEVELNNLTLNRANGISLDGDVNVKGTLALTTGTLTVGPNTLTISGNSPTRVAGNIDASNSSATMVFTNTSTITCPESIFINALNNVTINGAGISGCCSCTINGVLNLQSANPSDTKGTLDMGTDTLTMGANATTIGIGDVTGIVKREHTFTTNTAYTFGSQYTTFTFIDANTKPTWICVKISIGTVPAWTPWTPTPDGKVKRLYQISCSDNSSTSQADINMRYLLSELDATNNDESKLVFWHKKTGYAGGAPHEHGRANQDLVNHFIGVVGLTFGTAVSTILDDSQVAIAYSVLTKNTWKGEVVGHETEWEQPNNWSAGTVPVSTDDVLIPGGLNYYPSLTASSNAVAKTIEIEIGASITANVYDITISGAAGAWLNHGTFNAGTAKVLFNHGVINEVVTIGGTTDFYDIEVAPNTWIKPVAGSVMRIAGAGIADATSLVDFSTVNNTVEWNGGDQTIINPTGFGGNSGYYNLRLSGSGTKTMPTTALNIADEFVLTGSLTATAQSSLTIGGELEILNGATFATGAFNHFVAGPFDVGGHLSTGTFVPTAGYAITLNGTTKQNIYGDTDISFENLTIDNNAGVDVFTNIAVNGDLTLTNGNLDIGATTLSINGDVIKTGGFIKTTTLSSLIFGGTTTFAPPVSVFLTPPNINNLTINRTGGVQFSSDFTINGTLNLQSANPSSTIGTMDMGTSTLYMADTAITTGVGDVTGIIRREHIFATNTAYTFGSQYTTIDFIDENQKPTWISIKVSLGAVASWSPWSPSPNGKVKRLYQLACSDNSSTAQTNISMRYLPSELDATYNDESKLVFWHKKTGYAGGAPHEHGKAVQDLTNHYIGVVGLVFGSAVTSNFDDSQFTMAYSATTKNTWKGEVVGHETEWEQAQNWTAGHVPLSTEDVLIPGSLSYYPSLTASANAVAKTIEIETGASVTANSYDITISGAGGAWLNNGTFTPGTGTVSFNHGVSSEIATIAGVTNFYSINIDANTTVSPVPGSIFRIAGTVTDTPTSKADWSTINSTVEWNGVTQSIYNPQGIGGKSGYYNLIISGSGTKTMAASALTIHGDFNTSGTTSVSASDSVIVNGNMTLGSGTTFTGGSHTHVLKGNFENNGTFTTSTGGTMMFAGTTAQTISGTATTTFDILSIDNSAGVTQANDIIVNNELELNNGILTVGSNTLEINGTIVNPAGSLGVSSGSSLSFGGTNAITLNDNLFNANPTITDLTINRSGGVTLGNESITVNGTLTLTNGTLTIAGNSLTLAGNSLLLTAGDIDASNASATIAFENSSAITLPASLFSASVNNMTVNGAGITAGNNITINGILSLQSANPSDVKGCLDMSSYTLDMGEDATTIGQGDVSGIIRRTSIVPDKSYSFGNEFTTISFPDVGTLPTQMSVKVTLGTAATWRTGTIKRIYEIAQTGGSGTQALIKNHYLDSELNGNSESKLGEWVYYNPPTDNLIDYGRSGNDVNDNWVTISNVNIGIFYPVFGIVETAMDEYENTALTWTGATSTSWVTATNWFPLGAPSDETAITIPDAATTPNDPFVPELAICGKMRIEPGGILNSKSGGVLTITGGDSAWVNNGTFNPETGTIVFHNGVDTNAVTIIGTTDFYNLTIGEKTWFQPAANSTINVASQLSADSITSIVDFDTYANTINYNGSKTQNILNPGAGHGYYNLSLSGSGDKIFPSDPIQISANLSVSENASATINNNITVGADVNISNTAILTIEADKTLTVNGAISNTAGTTGLVLQSTSSGTASLIHNTDNVPATVQRYISGSAEDWHFLSSPVSNQGISGDWLPAGTYGNGTGYDLYVWDEPTPCWVYYLNTTVAPSWPTVHPSANFVAGRGYLYSVQAANPTKEFVGNLNNGDQTIPLTYSGPVDTLKGFNLVGNPYPSSIDWKATSGWTRGNLMASGTGYDMWIWNPAANNYGVFNSDGLAGSGTNDVTQYIAPMQGFFVRASSSGNMVLTNSVRVHNEASNWKSAEMEQKVKVRIESESGNGYDEVVLQFGAFENESGAAKLFSPSKSAPSAFLPYNREVLSVLYLTDTKENSSVPLMFKPGSSDNFTLSVDYNRYNFDTFILEDKATHTYYNLKDNNSYRFSASIKDDYSRFVLHFEEISPENNHELPVNIYASRGNVVIDLTMVDEYTNIRIVDVLGRTILHKSVGGNTMHRLPVNARNQVIIVYVKTINGIIRKKIFVP